MYTLTIMLTALALQSFGFTDHGVVAAGQVLAFPSKEQCEEYRLNVLPTVEYATIITDCVLKEKA